MPLFVDAESRLWSAGLRAGLRVDPQRVAVWASVPGA